MKFTLQLLLILIFSVNLAFAQSSSGSSTAQSSSGYKSYPPKSSNVGDNNSNDTYTTRDGSIIYAKGREKSEAENKKLMESLGYKYYPMGEGLSEKDWVEDKFTIPQDELLEGCTYVPSFAYPSNCSDKKGNIIFRASKHKQKVLDKIIEAQGKTKGKYNKMPNGGPVTEKDLGVD